VRVHPKSSRNKIGEYIDSILHIYVTALPDKGKANQAVVNILSKKLKVSKSKCEILRGHTSKNKVLSLNMTQQEFERQLNF
jgi:uncharacterized protein (TIGR00251 family)